MPKQIIDSEMRRTIVEMTENGHTINDICNALNISSASVSRIRNEEKSFSPYHKGGTVSKTIPKIKLEGKSEKKEEEPKECFTVLSNKTIELCGINTGFIYTATMSKNDTLQIKTGYCEDFLIDYKDLANFANELFEVLETVQKMRNDRFSV